ncbi:Oidioi.mRNA.OKI2018_I69.chr2.g5964.t1.cds [Oikopleura dioica]|uniref:Oidioi.mRNA.OKI2018_I69.chr2.g5964.t1.cds n=1 Tax=Oikopleura dioica TaxID=34765 RepID=A0ABN7T6D7_OIKDI|nr:Oidioi.mRNA.OKI2018_I69.chr2.g5964.t1.cds [Oikopleura dioica]
MPLRCLANAIAYCCGMQVVILEQRVEENEEKIQDNQDAIEEMKLQITHLKKGIPLPSAKKTVIVEKPKESKASNPWGSGTKKPWGVPEETKKDSGEDEEYEFPYKYVKESHGWY